MTTLTAAVFVTVDGHAREGTRAATTAVRRRHDDQVNETNHIMRPHLATRAATSPASLPSSTAREVLLVGEKPHTGEGDAIAAARRRLPMVELDGAVEVTGADGPVPFLDRFQGRDDTDQPLPRRTT